MTRRGIARPLLAIAAGLGLAPFGGTVATKNGRRRKKRKKHPDAVCPGACPVFCSDCFVRAEGPPLCGDGIAFAGCDAFPCASDNDCVGARVVEARLPYCVVARTFEGGPAERLCPDGPDQGACIDVLPCDA